jgi:ferredoxin-NADP reductase
MIEQHLGQISSQTFFICGPVAFMATVKESLKSLGVHGEQILQEHFTGSSPKSVIALEAL